VNQHLGPGHASLAMYSFEQLRPAYQRYWTAVRRHACWLPERLEWPIDVSASWLADDLVVAQTCGWPLVTELSGRVRVLGAFCPAVPGADGHRYRSVLVANRQAPARDFIAARAAVNSMDSLSGWVSLVAAVAGPAGRLEGPVTWTGSHLDSVRALHADQADVASIDGVSWAHIVRLWPELASGLVQVGDGPLVPSLPVITSLSTSNDQVDAIRHAMAAGFHDTQAAAATAAMLMTGFVPLDAEDYESLHCLAPGPPPGASPG
jgi:ABC-type phosphate/phosphonate transport system substrate-binding protein